jgi:hypothetical protein
MKPVHSFFHALGHTGVLCSMACASGLWLAVPAHAQTPPASGVQTLLYSPEQRAAITRQRHGAGTADTAKVADSVLRLDGVVRRANRKGTAWVNGQAMPEQAAQSPRLTGQGAVVNGQALRVGESVDTTSGTRQDVVQPGAVKVRPAP